MDNMLIVWSIFTQKNVRPYTFLYRYDVKHIRPMLSILMHFYRYHLQYQEHFSSHFPPHRTTMVWVLKPALRTWSESQHASHVKASP